MALEASAPETVEDDSALASAFTDAAAQPVPEAQPEVQATPESPPPTVSPYFERAKSLNLPLDGIDSNEKLIEALLDHTAQSRPYVQAGQHFLAQPAQQPEPEPEPEAKEEFDPNKYFSEKWNVPKWESTFTQAIQAGFVQQDDSGKWVAAPGAEMIVAPILGPLNQAHAAKQQAIQGLFNGNFYEQLYSNLLEPLRREWQKDVQQNLGQFQQTSQQQQFVEQFEREHAPWLYKTEAGQRFYSERGEAFLKEVETLKASGLSDPKQVLTLALRLAGGAPQAQPAAPAQAQPTAPTAPATPVAKSNGKKQAFLDNAIARAGHAPQANGYTQAAPDDPVVMNRGELESMFTRAASQQSHA